MYERGGIIQYLSISDKRIKYKDKTYRLGSYLHLACIASCTAVSGRWLRKRTVQLIAQHSSWARNKVCLKISTCQVFCLGMKQTLWVILPRTCPTFLCKPLALEYCFKSWCILFIVQTIFFCFFWTSYFHLLYLLFVTEWETVLNSTGLLRLPCDSNGNLRAL